MKDSTVQKLLNSQAVVILTGAGISAASGVPTFRGADGLWKNYRPEELANYQAFIRNPELVWDWYSWRRDLIKKVNPNTAHVALVEFERILNNFFIVTQNVDNLHQRSGSKNVIELHGNIMHSKCINCENIYFDEKVYRQALPHCELCNSLIRPAVVWFGESLPLGALTESQKLAANCQVFLSVGTSAVVEPAASLPFIARDRGAYVIEINKDETPLTPYAHEFIGESAEKYLPELLHHLKILNLK
jgi:NAD-dependent deacetylase